MPNPFLNWTPEMVAAHNARVSGKTSTADKPGLTQIPKQDVPGAHLRESASICGSTNLVLVKSTDEQKLNKLERDWLRQLRLLYPSEVIGIQNIQLKLADDTRYTPDFNFVDPNGQLIFHETKGYMRDDARAKIFIAARSFRYFRFVLVRRVKGQWIETPVPP